MTSSVDGCTVSPRKSRRKSACFSRTITGTPARASRTPSIMPAGPPPAIQQRVWRFMSASDRFQRSLEVACGVIVVRLQGERRAEFGDRLVNLLLADQRKAEKAVRRGIV